jgi:hypothetical protein
MCWIPRPDPKADPKALITVEFTRVTGLVKESLSQDTLKARVAVDFERRQPRRVQAVLGCHFLL